MRPLLASPFLSGFADELLKVAVVETNNPAPIVKPDDASTRETAGMALAQTTNPQLGDVTSAKDPIDRLKFNRGWASGYQVGNP